MSKKFLIAWFWLRQQQRKRLLLATLVLAVAILILLTKQQRRSNLRRRPTHRALSRAFLDTSTPSITSFEFRRHYRLSREIFDNLVRLVPPPDAFLHRKHRLPFSHRLLIVIYRLATGLSVRDLSTRFGVSESTVIRSTKLLVPALVQHLRPFLRFPVTAAERQQASENFEKLRLNSGFRRVIGAIDGTHIRLGRRPEVDGDSYFNRKKFYSIQMQAVVNSQGRFIDYNIGWPGSVHDAQVLRNSGIFHRSAARVPPPFFLIGDSGYPLLDWLITPFRAANTRREKRFNRHLSSMRVVVEQAFGRLKGRWRILLNGMDVDLEQTNQIIECCVLLHNFCEETDDIWDEEEYDDQPALQEYSRVTDSGSTIRNNIADALLASSSAVADDD